MSRPPLASARWVCAILGCVLTGPPRASAQTPDLEREGARLTARLLIERIDAALPERAVPAELLQADIAAATTAHVERAASAARLQRLAHHHLAAWRTTEVTRVLDRLDAARPGGASSRFSASERRDRLAVPTPAIAAAVAPGFEALFATVRTQAVTSQWLRLSRRVQPTEAEVDDLSRPALQAAVLERLVAAQTEPVLEENRARLDARVVGPLLDDACAQRDAQLRRVQRSAAGAAWLPDAIAAQVRADLQQEQADLRRARADDPQALPVYGLFPSAERAVPARALELATLQVVETLQGLQHPLPRAAIARLIAADPRLHVDAARSAAACAAAYGGVIRAAALEACAAAAPAPQRDAAAAFVAQCCAEDRRAAAALEDLVTRSIATPLTEVRLALAQQQWRRWFAPLADDSWRPPDALLAALVHARHPVDALGDPLAVAGIASTAFATNAVLDETRSLVADAVRAGLTEGLAALRQQLRLVESLQPALRDLVAAGTARPTLDALVQTYRAHAQQAWACEAAAPRYAALFPRVEEEIQRRARELLPIEAGNATSPAPLVAVATLRAAAAAAQGGTARPDTPAVPGATPAGGAASGGGTAGGDGTGGQGDGSEAPHAGASVDFFLDVDSPRPGCGRAVALLPDGTREELTLTFDARGAASPDTAAALTRMGLALATHIRNTPAQADFLVLTRVYDGQTPYAVVHALREAVREAVSGTEAEAPRVRWCDAFLPGGDDRDARRVPSHLRGRAVPLGR